MAPIKNQTTLKKSFQMEGRGLHTGKHALLKANPAPAGTGYRFKRTDLAGQPEVQANLAHVTATERGTVVKDGEASAATIEHLLGAFYGMGVDNVLIEISGPEVPILDGSSSSFVFLLQSAGIVLQNAPRRFIRVKQPVEVRQGEGAQAKWARLDPYHGFKLRFEIDFAHPAVDSTGQCVEFDLGAGNYSRDIARARTFGFTKDVEMMRSSGLALGGGLDNAIVMDDYKVLNADGLRYDDEFVKHKILDAMGDLYLVGKPLLAAYSAFRSGHALNNLLLRELEAHPEAWEIVTFDNERLAPTGFAQPARAW